MKVIRCKGGCGKIKETATVNQPPSAAGHTTTAPWTCPECAARIARRAGKNQPKASATEKKDVPFTLIPPKHVSAGQPKAPAPTAPAPAAGEAKPEEPKAATATGA